jgi:hypothetical protein
MDNIGELIEGLQNKDNNYAYKCFMQLKEESELSKEIYSYFDTFAQMVDNPNSFIRTRGLLLIAANAKWDDGNKIDEIIDAYLKHIMDEKPITSRQCIKALPSIAKFKPDLIDCICAALNTANTGIYNSNMQPLVYSDIQTALRQIKCI